MKVLLDLLDELDCNYIVGECMSRHTTMKVGGKADVILFPHSEEVICSVMACAKANGIPLTVIGNGSNLLVSDSGIRGAVLCIGEEMSDVRLLDDGVIYAQAGASLMKVCKFALKQGLSGMEFAYGIPGSCGGAAFMNAGAYGGEMKDVLYRCDHVDADGQKGCIENEALQLSYRHSAYETNGCIITGIYLKLSKGDKKGIKCKMDDLLARRKSKQPLEYPSAGSTFKRPEGYFAAALIEECGLKGKTCGGAMVSEKHSGFVINFDHATCGDVMDLCRQIQATVLEKKGIDLEMEVRTIE